MDKLKLILSFCLLFLAGISSAKIAKSTGPPDGWYRKHTIPLNDCPNLNEDKCLNNEGSLKCYLQTIASFFKDDSGCDAFFYQTSCTPTKAFDALKSFCPHTVSQYCPAPLTYSFLPNHQYTKLIADAKYDITSPKGHIEPFVKEMGTLISEITCEKIVKQYGCFSTSAIFSSEIMIEYCAATYYNYCKDSAIPANTIVQYEKTAQEIMMLSQSGCVEITTKPAIIDEITTPTITDKITEPMIIDEITEPTIIGELKKLTITDEITEPTIIDEITEPTITDEITKPTIIGELKKLTITDEITKPTITDEITKPTITDEITKPTITDEITKPTITDEITKPTITDKSIHEITTSPVTFPSIVAPSFTDGFIPPLSEDGWSSSFYSKSVLAAITITIGLLASP